MGRPPIGKKAMTGAERVRRYQAKHDERLKAEATAALQAEVERLKAELKAAVAKVEVAKGLESNEQREIERLKAENGELRQQRADMRTRIIALRREVADFRRSASQAEGRSRAAAQ